MSAFEEAFGLPAGHSLGLVGVTARGDFRVWEHEERDPSGALVAIYESWRSGGGEGGLAYVKYSAHGWVLSISGRSPRLLPPHARMRRAETA